MIECAISCAFAAGTPFAISVSPTRETFCDTKIEPITARPMLAPKFRAVWVIPVTSP